MSANPLDMPIIVSQLPNLQQMANAAQASTETQQVLFGHLVAENQRKAEHTVQEVENTEGIEAMGKDSGGNSNTPGFARQQRHHQPEHSDDQPTQASNASPWSGNIINVKI